MHKGLAALTLVAVVTIAAVVRSAAAPADDPGGAAWNPRAAAAALDSRADWWTTWPNAQRDRGTFCVSCHTAAPYAIARPVLRRALGEPELAPPERRIVDNVLKRVRMWGEVDPFYPDQTRGIPKTSESRGTESVLNAVVLSSRDAVAGTLSEDTRRAFDNMWALQMRTGELSGAWAWLNFHYEPWEAPRSPYFGATLAAVAVGRAPGGYAKDPAIQKQTEALREFLRRGRSTEHLFNRLLLVWASSTWPGLLSAEEQQAIVADARRAQREDGGWNVASFADWKRVDGSALDTRSDGYGTALAVLAMQSAGVAANDPDLRRGVAWLVAHQEASGGWTATSLNKQREPSSDAGRFMSDAASAFAVVALTRDTEVKQRSQTK
jgi:hypothetical protein